MESNRNSPLTTCKPWASLTLASFLTQSRSSVISALQLNSQVQIERVGLHSDLSRHVLFVLWQLLKLRRCSSEERRPPEANWRQQIFIEDVPCARPCSRLTGRSRRESKKKGRNGDKIIPAISLSNWFFSRTLLGKSSSLGWMTFLCWKSFHFPSLVPSVLLKV